MLAASVVPEAIASADRIVRVEADEIARFAEDAIRSLMVASEASVPLSSATPTRFVVFRDAMGGSPVAIVIGKPDFSKAVPVRLHSACLTGDVFGSRRCDCGDQLRLALTRLDDLGGGVILYLAQEGRGLGLANKMRTYKLQDDGLDTFDANTTLGFDDDEREYGIAARMLQMLECTRVVLLTNNPAKLEGLTIKITQKAGVDGRLFGSVTNVDIVEALQKQGLAVEKAMVRMPAGPLKLVGEYPLVLAPHHDVVATINVSVVGDMAQG